MEIDRELELALPVWANPGLGHVVRALQNGVADTAAISASLTP
jgi:hypothetical protein